MQKFLYFILGLTLVVPNAVFAASTLPAVESRLVKNITYNSADVYAIVSPGTAEDNAYWFEWGMVGADDNVLFKTNRRMISNRGGKRDVYATIVGLSPDTQYFFRIVSENQSGTVSGNTVYFTSHKMIDHTESVVVATTRNVINIKEESALVYGYVAPHNTTAHAWIEWGADDKTEFSSRTTLVGRMGGETSETLTNLTPGTVYYYRQAAEGSTGVVYGNLKSFKTKGIKPTSEAKKAQVAQKVSTKSSDSSTAVAAKTSTSNKSLFASMFGVTDNSSKTNETDKLSNTGSVANSAKDVTVSIKAVQAGGSDNTVEYKITYKYNRKESATKAELKTVFPKGLVYAGDSTNNELLVIDSADGSKTYILPIGDVKKGDSRTFSIVAVLSSTMKKAPELKATLSFDSKSEGHLEATSLLASTASSSNSISFPTTLIFSIIFLILVVLAIIFGLKAKDLYKAALVRAEESKKKGEEITKTIEANLSDQNETMYGQKNEGIVFSPNMTKVPMKPTTASEYKNAEVGEMVLPGMEVV